MTVITVGVMKLWGKDPSVFCVAYSFICHSFCDVLRSLWHRVKISVSLDCRNDVRGSCRDF